MADAESAAAFYAALVLVAAPAVAPAAPIGPAPRPAGLPPAGVLPPATARERVLLATAPAAPLPPSNRGFALLLRSGWAEGTGLGADRQGAVEPLETLVKRDRRGIGGETAASLSLVGAAAAAAPQPPAKAAGAAAATVAAAAAPLQPGLAEALVAHERKRRRDAAIAREVFSALKDEPGPAPGPRRAHRVGASNPLRGLPGD